MYTDKCRHSLCPKFSVTNLTKIRIVAAYVDSFNPMPLHSDFHSLAVQLTLTLTCHYKAKQTPLAFAGLSSDTCCSNQCPLTGDLTNFCVHTAF